jgi:hypothetical protein
VSSFTIGLRLFFVGWHHTAHMVLEPVRGHEDAPQAQL